MQQVNEPDNTRGTSLRWVSALLTVLLVGLVFVVGVWVGGHPRQVGLDRLPSAVRDRLVDTDRTALATQVLGILKEDYYKPIDTKAVTDIENTSVAALVAKLGDPYTEYLDPEHYKVFTANRAGKYGGVGVEWRPDGDTAVIGRVFPEGPAAKAGIRIEDRIVAVDGNKVAKADSYAAMSGVKGDEGTKVTLRIARTGTAERDYPLIREEIRRPVVDSRVETVGKKRVGYVHLDQFTDGSAKAVRSAVRRFSEEKVSGIVFDLRGDGGGLVDEAVNIMSVFVPDKTLIATTKGRNGPREELKATGDPVDTAIPLVVLVDQNSASASEIVAGALRDAGRAKLVGTRTFGKALIQSTRTLANGGAIKFTIASYLTPKGFDLGSRGLPPDIEVADDPKTKPDEALARALQQVTGS
jgi:carboxyl-terminal processing protease